MGISVDLLLRRPPPRMIRRHTLLRWRVRYRDAVRTRIIVWAFLISALAGAIDFFEPAEDLLRAGRTMLRYEKADGSIVVVGVDDATAQKLGTLKVTRAQEAQVVENLFKAGARRVFFDRIFADFEPGGGDYVLAATMKKYAGRVFVGEWQDPRKNNWVPTLPNEIIRASSLRTTLMVQASPFFLTVRVPHSTTVEGQVIPALATRLSDRKDLNDGLYLPDYSLDINSVPTLSFSAVFENRLSEVINGADVIIAPTSPDLGDTYRMPAKGSVPGVYFHVAAAQTLKKGIPSDLGFLPLLAIVTGIAIVTVLSGQYIRRVWAMSTIMMIVIGIPLDDNLVSVDIVPGLVMLFITSFRIKKYNSLKQQSSASLSGLPHLDVLRQTDIELDRQIIAMRIVNFADIGASFNNTVDESLFAELVRRIRMIDPTDTVYHAADTLVWLSPIESEAVLKDHLIGLRNVIQRGIKLNGRVVDVSIAIGVDMDGARSMSSRVGSAIQCAGEAASLTFGVRFYDPERQAEAAWRLQLMSALDAAIDNGELWVAYQPKFDIRRNTIVGAEALVRWDHPTRGSISPEDFVRAAEDNHRVERLTRFVLEDAVRLAALLNTPDQQFGVAVNLSVQMLEMPDLLALVLDPLRRHGVAPEHLTLEVIETGTLDRQPRTLKMMDAIKAAGIGVSIDDFGTGSATIDYLRVVPADEVKLDRSFIRSIDVDASDRNIAEGTIRLAHALGRRVVAEGVETEGVMAVLRSLDCDQAQGYLIGRPMTAAQLAARIRAERRLSQAS